jgi:hypothetical protein
MLFTYYFGNDISQPKYTKASEKGIGALERWSFFPNAPVLHLPSS